MKAATKHLFKNPRRWRISIHAAREGGDTSEQIIVIRRHGFQSTPPVKAATEFNIGRVLDEIFQSTPPVKAATLHSSSHYSLTKFQSTPPVKAATQTTLSNGRRFSFQSTPPVKAATVKN